MPLPQRLIEGYASFRSGRYAAEDQRYRKLGETAQRPAIMMVACCDSRAAPETIFDAGPGEMFVVRNVANLVPPYAPDGGHHSTSAALEFAVLSLKVSHIVVMGHGRCGGIRAAVSEEGPLSHTDFIGSWVHAIKDIARIVTKVDGESNVAHERHIERASITHSLDNLRTFPWIRSLIKAGDLSVHGAWFDISMGELHSYDETGTRWSLVET